MNISRIAPVCVTDSCSLYDGKTNCQIRTQGSNNRLSFKAVRRCCLTTSPSIYCCRGCPFPIVLLNEMRYHSLSNHHHRQPKLFYSTFTFRKTAWAKSSYRTLLSTPKFRLFCPSLLQSKQILCLWRLSPITLIPGSQPRFAPHKPIHPHRGRVSPDCDHGVRSIIKGRRPNLSHFAATS